MFMRCICNKNKYTWWHFISLFFFLLNFHPLFYSTYYLIVLTCVFVVIKKKSNLKHISKSQHYLTTREDPEYIQRCTEMLSVVFSHDLFFLINWGRYKGKRVPLLHISTKVDQVSDTAKWKCCLYKGWIENVGKSNRKYGFVCLFVF